MNVSEIREAIKGLLTQINESNENKKPILRIPAGATGSAAGRPFEEWFQSILSGEIEAEIFGALEFGKYVIENHLVKKSLNDLLKTTWCASLQQLTASTISRIQKGDVPKLQQAFGDIVIKYGDDLNDVIIVDVKATAVREGKPIGRPPNIVSALRLLRFFVELFDEKAHLIDKVNVWFVGFDYTPIGRDRVRAIQSHHKDLFKLDLGRAPSINFDAAIQIQWHLRDMVEREDQVLEVFAKELAMKYLGDWKSFTHRRNKQLEEIVDQLFAAIKKSHAQKRIV